MSPWRHSSGPPTCSIGRDRGPELLLIEEASRWLADVDRVRRPDAVRSITAMLDRQQRVAACRASGRPVGD